MSKITDNAFLFQKTFGTSGVNANRQFSVVSVEQQFCSVPVSTMEIQQKRSEVYNNLYRKMQKKDRLAAGYTLEKYERIYRQAFYDAAKKADPNWENRRYNSDKKIKQR